MKIKYRLYTGEVIEIEVPDDVGECIEQSGREEHALEERERSHRAFSIDAAIYEGEYPVGGEETDPEILAEREEERERLRKAMEQITGVQRRRFERYADGESEAEIARSEGVSFSAVKESIEAARRKLKKILKNF